MTHLHVAYDDALACRVYLLTTNQFKNIIMPKIEVMIQLHFAVISSYYIANLSFATSIIIYVRVDIYVRCTKTAKSVSPVIVIVVFFFSFAKKIQSSIGCLL